MDKLKRKVSVDPSSINDEVQRSKASCRNLKANASFIKACMNALVLVLLRKGGKALYPNLMP
jgi:hypothetical protein